MGTSIKRILEAEAAGGCALDQLQLPAGSCVESKPSTAGQRGTSGCLADVGRGLGQPEARSLALRAASSDKPAGRGACQLLRST